MDMIFIFHWCHPKCLKIGQMNISRTTLCQFLMDANQILKIAFIILCIQVYITIQIVKEPLAFMIHQLFHHHHQNQVIYAIGE